jgi:ATP-dependent protease ClpP protease subunit
LKKVNIKGAIVSNDDQWIYEWCDIESTSPKSVMKEINDANGDELEVEINSGGGDIFAGSEIYTALKSYQGNVVVKVVGLAASAASVIAMAGKKVLMSPTAQLMIHNVSTRASGDHRDMEHTAEVLKNANETIANSYTIKSGMGKDELLAMMDHETWLTPQQALDHKFIDEIMFSNQLDLVASYGNSILPKELINKIRNTINPIRNESDIFMQQKAEAQLKLLKLKGGSHR